jgi:hypothetical protein
MSGSGEGMDFGKFTGRHKVILTLFVLAFVVMVYGVVPWEDLGLAIPTWWWWFPEMTACFLFFGILIVDRGCRRRTWWGRLWPGRMTCWGGADHRGGAGGDRDRPTG